MRRWQVTLGIALVLCMFSSGLTWAASGDEAPLPGTGLGAVLARWVERARLWLTFGEENRARLLLGYAQTRLREAGLLAERGDLERLGRVVAEHARLTQAAHEQLERAQRRGREVAELVDEVQHSLVQAGEMLARVRERVATRLGEGGAEPPGLERARQALVAAEKTVAEVFGRVEDVRARVPRPGTGR